MLSWTQGHEPRGPQVPSRPQPTRGKEASTATLPALSVEPDKVPIPFAALGLALARLEPRDLAVCRVVSEQWWEVATSPEVRRSCFMSHWRLISLVGEARNGALLDTATLSHFVVRHPVARTDSLSSLAVRYGVAPTSIKRLNNLISEHSLHSRTTVFIPVTSAAAVAGSHALFDYCRIACRELLVLLDDREAAAAREALARAEACGGGGNGGAGERGLSKMQEEALQSKLVALLGRSLHVDDATARYYLAEAGWCLKKAMALCEQDMVWESRAPGSRRRAPLRGLVSS